MLKIRIAQILLVCFLVSCDQNCNVLSDSINEQLKNDEEGQFTLQNTFDFTWSKLYIFDSYFTSSEMSEIIGHECNCGMADDPDEQYIFVDDAGVVSCFMMNCSSLSFSNVRNNGVVLLERHKTYKARTVTTNGRERIIISH